MVEPQPAALVTMASTSSGKAARLRRAKAWAAPQIAGVPGQPATATLRGRDEDLHAIAGENFDGGGIDVGVEHLLGAAGEQGDAGAALAAGGRDPRPGLRGRHAGGREVQH